MTKQVKAYIKEHLPYYGSIGPSKGRYKDVKGKAWDILSDYVRCRDWLKYGTCVSSGASIGIDWRNSDAGHFHSMAGHGAKLGFHEMNIHMQGKNENQLGSMASGAYYKETLIARYGNELIVELEFMKNETVKADDWYFIGRIEAIMNKFLDLKDEFPNFLNFPKYITKKIYR